MHLLLLPSEPHTIDVFEMPPSCSGVRRQRCLAMRETGTVSMAVVTAHSNLMTATAVLFPETDCVISFS